ncbi:related to ER membrane protein complex subunit 6 [Cephalotrichum gorgonifer]|uniref:ER membrane protein complex subunit 6 n=1 Tax=Cephalotrichum gorgonifer TaxID=2041049 RepID=A0AAE8SRC5_9PEZI|nr:related to ER membrane protein complex subunit 6 [Cephalotrichum gorgonifer]
MTTMTEEQTYQISPIVTESVVHNTKTLSNLQSITASLFGVTAGILGLESTPGFLFYLLFSAITILLFHAFRVAPESRAAGLGFFDTSSYFRGAFSFWGSGFTAGLPGFVLTWTLFYNLVRP